MSTAPQLHHSYEDYLSVLERSDVKLEYFDGLIYAMAGGTPAHAELAANTIAILKRLLSSCAVFSSDLKVRVEEVDLAAFPDASVICGERHVSRIDRHALTNPLLLVEVTSGSTEEYDRGGKLRHYQRIPSLVAVVIVSHRSPRITVVRRTPTGWDETDVTAGGFVELSSPPLRFAVDEVYAGVVLD
ncbi:MAG: Uma2 family endonuclease [Myxococcaceae bacterium]|nr:Uma2 family endonuclease [Myxococcaceae bacterium]